MIKGVNRTIIEVSNPCNRYFERALLFVRPSWEEVSPHRLQRQADCFVETLGAPPASPSLQAQKRRYRKIKRLCIRAVWWGMGFMAGALTGWWIIG